MAAARLADDAGNVFRWALRETRDLHGNAVHYDYQTVTDAGVAGGTVPGRQLYLRTIDYTRTGSTAGPYTVKFVRDSELAGYTRRPDVVIDARGGFKGVTAELLARIEVAYAGAAGAQLRPDLHPGRVRQEAAGLGHPARREQHRARHPHLQLLRRHPQRRPAATTRSQPR